MDSFREPDDVKKPAEADQEKETPEEAKKQQMEQDADPRRKTPPAPIQPPVRAQEQRPL